MSEAANSGGGEIVRGNGHAPGQSLGEPMPDVKPGTQPGSLQDMKSYFEQKNQQARQPAQRQPQARGKVAEFSAKLEASQQAPVAPNEAKPQPRRPENQGDPNQLKAPPEQAPQGDPQQVQGEQEQQQAEGEQEPEAQASLADQEALAKYREWEKDEFFPEDLLGKLHEVKGNGITHYVDGNELRQGYIRGLDYRRGQEQAKAVEARANQREQAWHQHFEDVRDPEKMLEIYERQGYGETLEGVARLVAQRMQGERDMVLAAGESYMRRHGIQDPNHHDVRKAMDAMQSRLKEQRNVAMESKKLAWEKQQLQQQRAQQQSQENQQQYAAQYERSLNQLRPLAFRAYGISDSQGTRMALLRHLGSVIDAEGFKGEITRDLVMKAAEGLSDEQRQQRALESGAANALTPEQWKAQQRSAAAGNGRPLAPRVAGGGGGQPLGTLAGRKAGSLADLERMVRDGRLNRR